MNIFQIVLTTVLTMLILLAFTVAGVWATWPQTAQASVAVAAHASTWHQGQGDHCARLDASHIDLGEALVTATLDLSDAQQSALTPISEAAQRWQSVAKTTCENANFSDLNTSLAEVENALSQSSAAVREMRPLIADFYANLDTDQQDKLQQLMHSHGPRHGRRFARH